MKRYDYKCDHCGFHVELPEGAVKNCPHCGMVMRKKFSFSVGKSFEPHFNHSVGQYVQSEKHMRDILSRQSDVQSERLGVEHRFTYVDPADTKALGVTEEGLYEQARVHSDAKGK